MLDVKTKGALKLLFYAKLPHNFLTTLPTIARNTNTGTLMITTSITKNIKQNIINQLANNIIKFKIKFILKPHNLFNFSRVYNKTIFFISNIVHSG